MQTTIDNVPNTQTQTTQQQYSQNNQHNIKKQEHKQKWQKVEHKKRRTNSENINSRKRQMSISDYWLNKPIETSNTYEKLNVEETPEIREKLGINLNRIEEKSPPIFVESIENIIPLKQLLEEIAKDKYTIKILRSNQVKIHSIQKNICL